MIVKSKNLWHLVSSQIKTNPVGLFVMMICAFICMYPECSLAAADSIEGQITKIGTLGNGKLKTVGFSVAGIGGGIVALLRGNIKYALVIVGIGVGLALYLEWVASGMKLLEA